MAGGVAGIPVRYTVGGIDYTAYSDAGGVYTITVLAGMSLVITLYAIAGYSVAPAQYTLTCVTADIHNLDFLYTAAANEIELARATAVLPAYRAAPNTWPLHGTMPPNLYMVDRILISLPPSPPIVVKWAYGVQDAAYFATNGFDITDDFEEGLPATVNATYTVFAALQNGFIGVASIAVDNLRDGTNARPYLLIDFSTATSLAPQIPGIAQYTLYFMQNGEARLTANYELYQDIQMAERAWTPVGIYDGAGFAGTLDGNGHAINNLTMVDAEPGYLALFGMVTSGASIANLSVTNCLIESAGVAAAIAASSQSQSGTVSFVNCAVTGSIIGASQVAGILGLAVGNTGLILIRDCQTNASIEGYNEVGGIAGYLEAHGSDGQIVIVNCHSQGTALSSFNTGGIVGYAECTDNASVSITNCYNLMTITEELSSASGIAGLVVAVANSNILIQSCFNSGTISGYAGVAGILARGASYDGSLITVTDCYSVGDRVSTEGSPIYDNNLGGTGSILYRDSTGSVLMQNCYSTGTITSAPTILDSVAGGILGSMASFNPGSAVLQNCVALENSINGNSADTARILGQRLGAYVTLSNNWAYEGMQVLINGVPKSPLDVGSAGLDGISANAATLTTQSTYQSILGWDFTDTWSFGNGAYALPILRGVPADVQPTESLPYLT